MLVAQSVERSLQIPEVCGSNPIGYSDQKDWFTNFNSAKKKDCGTEISKNSQGEIIKARYFIPPESFQSR